MDSLRLRPFVVGAPAFALAWVAAACAPAGTPPSAGKSPVATGDPSARAPVTKEAWFLAPGVPGMKPCIVSRGGLARFDMTDVPPGEVMTVVGLSPDGHQVMREKISVASPELEVRATRYTAGDLILVRYLGNGTPTAGKPCQELRDLPNCGTPTPPAPPCIP